MPLTYEPIATTTLSSSASTITFNSIPATYTDLRLVLTAKSTIGGGVVYPAFRFNSDTGTNYSNTFLLGNGSTASSLRGSNETQMGISSNGSDSTYFGFYTLDIFGYAGSTNKSILATASEDANGGGTVIRTSHLYRSASAISSILLRNGTYEIGTTMTLYGIKNA
jgi:hypothetical protein